MDILVDWGVNALSLVDNATERLGKESDIAAVNDKIGWVRDFRKEIAEWKQIMELVGITETFVRTQGLFRECDKTLRCELRFSSNATERVIRIRWSLIEYVLNESLKARPGERLLGSSEIVESVFGSFKYLQGEHARGSLTGLVLAIPAMVARTTQQVVHSALETVPVKVVRTWIKEKFGKSARAKRKEAFSVPRLPEQKRDRFYVPA